MTAFNSRCHYWHGGHALRSVAGQKLGALLISSPQSRPDWRRWCITGGRGNQIEALIAPLLLQGTEDKQRNPNQIDA